MARLWIAAVAVVMSAGASAAEPDHPAEVEAFARIMADIRTTAERCIDLTVDWTALAAAKDRLRIADIDYFAFRKQAHDLADDLADQLGDDRAVSAWCSQIFDRYGPQGQTAAGLVKR